jgi:NADP-dependent 3-hydroxy acid dehydrogenase YdfG
MKQQTENERNNMKTGKLNGKVAVITGASKGIGTGYRKVICDARSIGSG